MQVEQCIHHVYIHIELAAGEKKKIWLSYHLVLSYMVFTCCLLLK